MKKVLLPLVIAVAVTTFGLSQKKKSLKKIKAEYSGQTPDDFC